MNVYAQRAQLGSILSEGLNGGGESTEQSAVVQKPTYLEFPNVGSEEKLYIDTSNNSIYRWDNKDVKYYRIATAELSEQELDYVTNTVVSNISIISGGSANG